MLTPDLSRFSSQKRYWRHLCRGQTSQRWRLQNARGVPYWITRSSILRMGSGSRNPTCSPLGVALRSICGPICTRIRRFPLGDQARIERLSSRTLGIRHAFLPTLRAKGLQGSTGRSRLWTTATNENGACRTTLFLSCDKSLTPAVLCWSS